MPADTGAGRRPGSASRPGSLREALARDIVARIAPDELPVVAGYARQRPLLVARRLRSRRRRRDPLAFGLEATVGLVAPLVWLAVDEAVRRIGQNAGDGISKRLERAVRRLSGRRPGQREQSAEPQLITFTPEQLAAVHATAIESAARHGTKAKTAAAMADSIVAVLALTASGVPRRLEIGGDPEAGGLPDKDSV